GVFASRWPLDHQTVWTIVNRNEYDVDGHQMEVLAESGVRYFDLYHGTELKVEHDPTERALLGFRLEAHGYGAILATDAEPDTALQKLMSEMRQLTANPLSSYSHEWKVLHQEIMPMAKAKTTSSTLAGMIKIPEGDFLFKVGGIEIEGSAVFGSVCSIRGEKLPGGFPETILAFSPFISAKFPVPIRDFKTFL